MSKIFPYKDRFAAVIEMPRAPGEKRKQKWIYGKSQEEVQAKLNELRYLLQTDQYVDESNITVKAHLLRWLETHKSNISPNTIDGYRTNIEKHIIPYIGGIKLRNLTAMKIQELYAKLLESGRADGKGGLSPTSVLYVHRVLTMALTAAKRMKLIRDNPMENVIPPRKKKRTIDENTGLLTEKGIIDLLQAFKGDRLEVPLYFAAAMGMRRGEILGLKWDKVDLENKLLHVHRALSYTKEAGLQIGEPKSEESYRTLMLPLEIITLLEEHRKWQESNKKFFGDKYKNKPPFDNLVVCKDNGEPYLPGSFSHIIERAIIQKGLPKTSLHPLRHSFATLLLKYGTDIKVASSLLGHSRASFTQDTYQHTLDEMKYKTAKKISSRLLKKVDKDKKNSPQG